jgi:hypothetical protein
MEEMGDPYWLGLEPIWAVSNIHPLTDGIDQPSLLRHYCLPRLNVVAPQQ